MSATIIQDKSKVRSTKLLPRIAKDSKKITTSDDVGSMDLYSRTSSFEPVYDHSENEILSLGLSATPGDEFTAAPHIMAENRVGGKHSRQHTEMSHSHGPPRVHQGTHDASKYADCRGSRWHRDSYNKRQGPYGNGGGVHHCRRGQGGRVIHGS